MSTEIQWNVLRHRATEMLSHAYAPYSHYPVGAAGVTSDGRVVAGCNVENVSYGLGICAEVSLVAQLISQGDRSLRAVTVTDASGKVLMPCGRCRQVLLEHGGRDLLVDHPAGPRLLSDLLPDAFGPDDIAQVVS
ncbi:MULTISPECIES: cytidine deaminase [Gordonia]|uniref:Cytidine deaminase n=1 Tax=Gordonia alkanivorans NBRC 16433 TaxID=1027371 RepID=F9VWU2_9ACTN|nr:MULTISPECIES: cytidine deaminase [Gordonia]AZZ83852.1 cytidine deaminase [Gordonia alkanivorans]MDH3019046.1 cytidine deaminase [Gordonia alkanivorans]MDH3023091.1 cytidine deaminase [Gordonia alkanivorans]MDH3047426.1 cytidine deaminase [Gordonia alkanivorans]MDJ0006103.1 cytidine deaminase [Gordonia alkanivorans]